jgi:hypothetical protein
VCGIKWWCDRRRSCYRVTPLVTIAALLYVVVSGSHKAWPYLFFSRWKDIDGAKLSSSLELSGIWIDSWKSNEPTEHITELLKVKLPDLVIISGRNTDAVMSKIPIKYYQHRVVTSPAAEGEISIASKISFATDKISELGLLAFPGGVISLNIPGYRRVELGVMALEPSLSGESFERNRVTARRLSSLMRNSIETRIVAASFNTTPFSQIASIYTEQTRMRSLMFGLGLLKTYNMLNPWSSFTYSNVFVSKDIKREKFERISLKDRTHAALYFKVSGDSKLEFKSE